MNSPLLSRPGAVAAEDPDSAVAAHYGEPAREQRALAGAGAWVDRSNRGVVRVSGPDRLSWLHSLTSQYLEGLEPGRSTEALLLDPKGHIQHHMSIQNTEESVFMHVEPGGAAELAAFLDSRRFMLRVEVADATADYAMLTVGRADEGKLSLGGVLDEPAIVRHGVAGADVFVPRGELKETADRLTERIPPAGLWAYEALRVAAHQPRLGLDTDHRAIPHEMGWIGSAVHLDKGCYTGQETVARVHNLGRPPRRLVMLHLDGSADRLPKRGADIELDGRTVGFVGTSARHYELGPIALGLVKRNLPVDADLLADGVAAAQEVVVSPDTGANAQITLRRSPS